MLKDYYIYIVAFVLAIITMLMISCVPPEDRCHWIELPDGTPWCEPYINDYR